MATKYNLCGCMFDVLPEQIPEFLNYPGVDLVEWRLDAFITAHSKEIAIDSLDCLSSCVRHPVLATNRPTWEGGRFNQGEESRFEILKRAVEAGVDWVDVEAAAEDGALQWFKTSRAKVLLSHHDFEKTPDHVSLQRLAERMAKRGADAIKIVTYCRDPEDNLGVLGLIPFCRRELGVHAIAFCMGPLGRWSRLASLLIGSLWTYVQFDGETAAASGQFTVGEIRGLLEQIV